MTRILLLLLAVASLSSWGVAAEIDDLRLLYRHGEYGSCLEKVKAAIERGVYGEAWHQLQADAEIALGQYQEALQTLQTGIEKYSWSIRLRWQLLHVAPFAGHADLLDPTNDEIGKLAQASPWRYTDAENLIVLGRWAIEQRGDPKEVRSGFFLRARRNNPLHREPRLALGGLALDKRDFQLAAEVFREAVQQDGEDPDYLFGLAQALQGSEPQQAAELVTKTLEINPHHAEALLWQADRLLEAEKYAEARGVLKTILANNLKHPEALAFLAAIEFIQGNEQQSAEYRTQALSSWDQNPVVDHIIGRECSQKYRFAEGAAAQRKALEFDADYTPAQKQLAEDLLRLGQEEEGWKLADQAATTDAYDVAVYNLITLRDEIEKYTTLEADGLRVRMEPHEARVYGDYVVTLLQEARARLSEKYQVELKEPTLVEIFPHPDDFAVRTFGMPGAGGYLGVCFGNVITANSPASQNTNPVNWESVLWHEYAHVITLNKTHNRMPRWLSEGISVYEERQRNPSWGEKLTPAYRSMILGEDLTPIAELSGAFLSPKSGLHLQFAYYESSLVVEFIIEQYGFEPLLQILDDLGVGITINDAIERHTEAMPDLEQKFRTYAQELAQAYAPGVDWSDPDLAEVIASPSADVIKQWIEANPTNYAGLSSLAQLLVQQEQWTAAEPLLEQIHQLFPGETGSESPTWLLAQACRRVGKPDRERELLLEIADRDDDHALALIRLLEIETERGEWEAVRDHAAKLRGIKPLIRQPYSAMLQACDQLQDDVQAVPALNSLLQLEPEDPADLHFRLARKLVTLDDKMRAKRQVLMSLEYAPRYREALQLLLDLEN